MRRISDARHGVPQRGSKKQENLTWTGTILLQTDRTKYEASVHEHANRQDASGSGDETKKMPEGLGDGGERNGIEWSNKRSAI